MTASRVQLRQFATACALSMVLALAGCGGVEIESKLLDNIGVSGLFGDGKHVEQKLETRSALVVPPSVEALPAPGTGGSAAPAVDPSFPQNPETVAAAQKRAAEEKRKRDCDANNGAFGTRQSGQHADNELDSSEKNSDCSTPLKDLIGSSL